MSLAMEPMKGAPVATPPLSTHERNLHLRQPEAEAKPERARSGFGCRVRPLLPDGRNWMMLSDCSRGVGQLV